MLLHQVAKARADFFLGQPVDVALTGSDNLFVAVGANELHCAGAVLAHVSK